MLLAVFFLCYIELFHTPAASYATNILKSFDYAQFFSFDFFRRILD